MSIWHVASRIVKQYSRAHFRDAGRCRCIRSLSLPLTPAATTSRTARKASTVSTAQKPKAVFLNGVSRTSDISIADCTPSHFLWYCSYTFFLLTACFVCTTASRLDYDGKLDWSLLRKQCRELILHPVDNIQDKAIMNGLVKDADIVITSKRHCHWL
jgi:hypothetical protein